MPLKYAVKTDIGNVRQTNEDSFLVLEDIGFFAVADGMGGHAGGEIASQMCVDELAQHLRQPLAKFRSSPLAKGANTLESMKAICDPIIQMISTKIYERALVEPALKGMGTTLTSVFLLYNRAYYAHVGDSRLYLFRKGFLYQISVDHTLVQDLLQEKSINKEEFKTHKLRNIITRCVGFQEVENIDYGEIILENGDLLLLCSDGLSSLLEDTEIALELLTGRMEALDPLVNLAKNHGGSDNITVILVEYDEKNNP